MEKENLIKHNTLFTYYYRNPENLIRLHDFLFPEDQYEPGLIENITVEDDLIDQVNNGIRYSVVDRMVILVESQVIQSPYLVAYFLNGYARMLQDYLDSIEYRDREGERKSLKLPDPAFVLVYTGPVINEKDRKETRKVILKNDNLNLEINIRVIYTIEQKSFLKDYFSFSREFNERLRSTSAQNAIAETIRYCMDGNILKDHLREISIGNSGELERIFEQEVFSRGYGLINLEDDLIDGFIHGFLKGEQRVKNQLREIMHLKKAGMSAEEISDQLNIPILDVRDLVAILEDLEA